MLPWLEALKIKTRPKRLVLYIVLVGIVCRLLFVLFFPRVEESHLMDSTRYMKTAKHLLEGRGFSEWGTRPTAFAPPMYPFFLAGIFKIFGYNSEVVKIIQAILGGVTCWIIYRMGCLMFEEKVGIVASLMMVFYPDLIALTGYLYTEILYIFILSLTFLFLMRVFLRKGSKVDWILAGVLLGVSILTRHALILFPIFILILLSFSRATRDHFKRLLVFVFVCYGVLIPWIIRNYLCFGEFIPVATGVGATLWVGSYIPHEGEYRYSESSEKVMEESRGAKSLAEGDKILFIKAFQNIISNPGEYGYIVLKKFIRYFYQIYVDIPDGRPRSVNIVVVLVLALSYYPVFLLFLTGIVQTRYRWKEFLPIYGLIFYSGILYAVTIIVPRYRVPLMPFFILFAASSLCTLMDRLFLRKKMPVDMEE